MRTLAMLLATVMVVGLFGCTSEEQGAAGGAVMGALLGAVVGNQTGNSREGAAVGALAGTIVGYHIGKAEGNNQGRVVAERLSVVCPYCSYQMGLPGNAQPGDIIECPNCHNEFVLRAY
jgi:outer membrane lipoprotein SlyB